MLTAVALRTGILHLIRTENRSLAALMRNDARNFADDSVDKRSSGKHRAGVLLLHHGQPRTPYYAKEFLTARASQFYKLPKSFVSVLISLFWPLFQKVHFCIADYDKVELLSTHVDKLASSLEIALAELVPEFGLIRCASAFQYENPAITRRIKQFQDEGINRLILLPLYPQYSCFLTGTMLNTALGTMFGEVMSGDIVMAKLQGIKPSMSDNMCKVTAIYRWNAHPVLMSFWQHLLEDKLDDHDSILFVAPQMHAYGVREYKREVWSSCERLMEGLGNSHTWRVAFYSSWDHWPTFNAETITWQLCLFRREKKERTLVVPINSVLPNFDTEIVLPNLLVNKGVDLVVPPAKSTALVNGLAEMVKNQLLGGGADAQVRNRCAFCINPRCEYTKSLLINCTESEN